MLRVGLGALCAAAARAQLDQFLPPTPNTYAANADLLPPVTVAGGAAACAARCVATPGCISFNLCGAECGVSGWSISTPARCC